MSSTTAVQQIAPVHFNVRLPRRLWQVHLDYCNVGPLYDAVTSHDYQELGASIQRYLRHPAHLRQLYETKYAGIVPPPEER